MPNFIPALRTKWLTPFYDRILPLLFPERQFREVVMQHAILPGKVAILDFGCGTGTLIKDLKAKYAGVKVLGVDIDLEILRIAKQKAVQDKLRIRFVNCSGDAIPFRTGSFDTVISTLVFHHLSSDQKISTLKELGRILKNAGNLVIGDLGVPKTAYTSFISRLLSMIEPISQSIHEKIQGLIHDSGFLDVCEISGANTLFGSLSIITARKAKPAQQATKQRSRPGIVEYEVI